MLVTTSPTGELLAFWTPHIFRPCRAALFLAHSHGSLQVWTSHTWVTCKTFVIRQNSTIITFHCETKACSESPDPSPTWDYGGLLGPCKSAYFKYGSILPSSIFRILQFCLHWLYLLPYTAILCHVCAYFDSLYSCSCAQREDCGQRERELCNPTHLWILGEFDVAVSNKVGCNKKQQQQ